MKKKLLFITHSYAMSGGAEDEFERLLKYFSEKNELYEIHGLFPEGPRATIYSKYCNRSGRYKYGHLPVIYEKFIDYIKYFLKSIIQTYQIIRFVIGQNYDITVINVVVLIWPALVMRILGCKVIVFIREDVYPIWLRHLVYKILSKTCSFFIPNSATKKQDFVVTTNNYRIKHIYPGIENENYNCSNALKKTIGDELYAKITEKYKFKIVNPAGVLKKKNQFLILKALNKLKQSGIIEMPIVFFVGFCEKSSSYAKLLFQYVKSNSLQKYCFFLGPLERPVLYELYQFVDITILTSLSEGMPIVMIESFKFKKPFISTKVGGIPEIVKNTINGFLIDFDEKQLSEVILQLMNDKRLYNKIKTNAFLTYEQYFNLNKSLNETEEIFQNVMNDSR